MAITNNKLLKQCKMKFSNCYELNNGIHNIPVFVDKFINRLSLGHFSFDLIYHLSGQLILLSVVFAGVGICRSIMAGHTLGAILPFYIVSFLGLYLYLSVSTVADIKGKRRVLKINLVDYLENHLSSRMSVTRRDMEMLYGDAAFQEKTGALEGQNAGRAARGKSGRKTVELMPVGGRLSSGKESKAIGASQGMSQEIRRMVQGSAAQDMSQEEAQYASQEIYQEESKFAKTGVTQEASQEVRRMVQEAAAKGMLQEASQQTSDDATVTEEELEMLLKEFLTG